MLSLCELERAASAVETGLGGARLDRVVQPAPARLVLVLYAPGSAGEAAAGESTSPRRTLLLCCEPEWARISELPRPPRAPAAPPAFASYLRKHLSGARLRAARLRGGDRQLELCFETREARFVLLLSIFGKRSNLYLLDGEGRLVRALRPLAETRSELVVGEPWRDPSSRPPSRGEDRFEGVAAPALLAAIEGEYAEREGDRQEADLGRRLEVALRKERKHRARRLERIESELAESEKASELHRQGELLKSSLGRVEPGASSVRVRDYASGEEVEIPLDPSLSPQQNANAIFKRYQKLVRRLTKAGGQVDEARARCQELDDWERERARLAEAGGDLAAFSERPEIAGLLRRHAPAVRRAPSPRRDEAPRKGPFKGLARRLHPRRYLSRDGLEIWVGRSDEGNDHLTTRLARGNDLFFHLDGAPGSHVILRTGGREEPPQESLLDAAELAVQYSKAKNASRADVHVAPIKQVKKPKGAKPGLVYVTGGRTLHLRREEARLRRVLDSQLDDTQEGPGG
ncbi:MAG: Rqc2 family fibronectin-binding protein [Myxococcota bacterium]